MGARNTHGFKLRAAALPPLPPREEMQETLFSSAKSNWVIRDRLMEGIEPDSVPEGASLVDAEVMANIDATDATKFIKSLREQVREEVLYVHSSGDQGHARVVCASLLALLYDVSAAEGIARAEAYATLRTKVDSVIKMSDAQKDMVEKIVRVTRQSDCAEE